MHKANLSKCKKFIEECNKNNTNIVLYEKLIESLHTNKELRNSNVAEQHSIEYLNDNGIMILDKHNNIIGEDFSKIIVEEITKYNDPIFEKLLNEHAVLMAYNYDSSNIHDLIDLLQKECGVIFKILKVYITTNKVLHKCIQNVFKKEIESYHKQITPNINENCSVCLIPPYYIANIDELNNEKWNDFLNHMKQYNFTWFENVYTDMYLNTI